MSRDDERPTTELDGSVAALLVAYRDIDQRMREWSEMRTALALRIKEGLGDAEIGMVSGKPLVRWTRYTTRRLSPAKVALVLTPEVLADCYEVTEARKFTVVGT